jgi:hypothetical protein
MTQRYAHLSPAYKPDAVNRIDTMWKGLTGPPAGLPASVTEQLSVTGRSPAEVEHPQGCAANPSVARLLANLVAGVPADCSGTKRIMVYYPVDQAWVQWVVERARILQLM